MISFFKEIGSESKYDIALVRSDHQNISGNGQIGTLLVVINGNIPAQSGTVATSDMLFSSIYGINNAESAKSIGADDGTFNVLAESRSTTGIKGLDNGMQLNIYPNPANDKLIISAPGITMAQLSLSSPDGRKVMSLEMTGEKQAMDISSLPDGFYILRFQQNGNTICRKVIVAR